MYSMHACIYTYLYHITSSRVKSPNTGRASNCWTYAQNDLCVTQIVFIGPAPSIIWRLYPIINQSDRLKVVGYYYRHTLLYWRHEAWKRTAAAQYKLDRPHPLIITISPRGNHKLVGLIIIFIQAHNPLFGGIYPILAYTGLRTANNPLNLLDNSKAYPSGSSARSPSAVEG